MKSLRVAMIAPPWLPVPPVGYGGIENVIDALVPELMQLGVKVELFTVGDSKVKSNKKHWIYKHGQYSSIHKPQYESIPISLAQLLFSLNVIRKDGKFDIIHDHSGFVGPLAFYLADKNLPPVVHTLHGPPFTSDEKIEEEIPDNRLMWLQYKETNRLFFVGISEALTKQATPNMKEMMLPVVHNAINVESFPYVEKKDDYFITLGRFHPQKGQDVAVRASAQLGYKLKMAGVIGDIDTPTKLLLELANPLSKYRGLRDFRYYSDKIFPHLMDNNIEYVGETSGKKKNKLISRAKALLFPVNWEEPFGMVPIEALACGTPVIAMRRGALPEIVEHGVNGFLADSEKDFKHYMTIVDEIDPAKCRQSAIDKFSSHIMAQSYLERYRTVLDKQSL